MQEDFELETILSLITGYNFTNNFDKIFELVEFVYEESFISYERFNEIKNEVKNHIYKLYPDLKNISFNNEMDENDFVSVCKFLYGDTLTISILGEKVIKLKPLVKTC